MIHLDLQPEVEAQLAAEAAARGIALDHYLQQIVYSRAETHSQNEQYFLDQAALADPEEGLRQGLEDIAAGRTRPAREVLAELREEYGIRG